MQLFPVYLSCVHPPRGRTWLHRRNVDRLLWDGPWLELPPLACFVESDVRNRLVCDGASKQSIGCCVWRHKTNGSKTSERIVYLWQSMNFVYNYNIVYNNILHVHVLLNYSSIIFIPYRFCPNHAPCIPTHVYKDLSMYYYYCCVHVECTICTTLITADIMTPPTVFTLCISRPAVSVVCQTCTLVGWPR